MLLRAAWMCGVLYVVLPALHSLAYSSLMHTYICGISVVPLWHQCGTSVVSVCYLCGISVVHLWYWCATSVASAWYICGICLVPLWYQCGTSVISVWCLCGISVVPLVFVWYLCGISLVPLWYLLTLWYRRYLVLLWCLVLLWYQCGISVVPLWCQCGTSVVSGTNVLYVWYISGTAVIAGTSLVSGTSVISVWCLSAGTSTSQIPLMVPLPPKYHSWYLWYLYLPNAAHGTSGTSTSQIPFMVPLVPLPPKYHSWFGHPDSTVMTSSKKRNQIHGQGENISWILSCVGICVSYCCSALLLFAVICALRLTTGLSLYLIFMFFKLNVVFVEDFLFVF